MGITIVGIIALAFWFGSLRTTVSVASAKTDKFYEIVLESKDSLNTRTGVLENKLDALDRKVTDVVIPLIPKRKRQVSFLVTPPKHSISNHSRAQLKAKPSQTP